MAFDFTKLSNMTQEERDERDRKRDVEEQQKELKERSGKATVAKKFTLIEDPEVRFDGFGGATAVLRGEDFTAISKSLIHEDAHVFSDRFAKLNKGDDIVAHGHMEKRSWKDRDNNWKSTQEFVADIPVSPAGMKHDILEGVKMPASAFALRQQQSAQQQMGR